jgi:hypothetical protein
MEVVANYRSQMKVNLAPSLPSYLIFPIPFNNSLFHHSVVAIYCAVVLYIGQRPIIL